GGAAGVLAGPGLIVVPGAGSLLAVGPLAAGLGGALLGGSVGGFAGALVGLGRSEEEARRHAKPPRTGGGKRRSGRSLGRPDHTAAVRATDGRHLGADGDSVQHTPRPTDTAQATPIGGMGGSRHAPG